MRHHVALCSKMGFREDFNELRHARREFIGVALVKAANLVFAFIPQGAGKFGGTNPRHPLVVNSCAQHMRRVVKLTTLSARTAPLTASTVEGMLDFPKPVRHCRSLYPSQAGENRGVFSFCHQSASTGVGYILAEQRPGVREAPAVSLGRGALFCLFCSQSQTSEVHHV